MKKFFLLILIGVAGYLVYDNFIKEKEVLEIKANKSINTVNSMDPEAPALTPSRAGKITGTVKNLSDKPVSNIVLKYKLNGDPVEARIDYLDPGETKNFSTQSVSLRYQEVSFYLEEKSYQ